MAGKNQKVHDIGEALPEAPPLDGEQVKDTTTLVGVPIIIRSHKVRPSSYHPDGVYAAVQAERSGKPIWFNTSAGVVIEQLDKLSEAGKLPVICTFDQRKSESSGRNYFILVPTEAAKDVKEKEGGE